MDEFEAIVQQQLEIDRRFLREAYKYAMKHSEDPSTAAGVVIVKNGREIMKGANRLCPGVVLTPDILSSAAKYDYFQHAERDSICSSAKMGIPLLHSTMYTYRFPCAPCMGDIIFAGISEIVTHKEYQEHPKIRNSKWVESQRIAEDIRRQNGLRHREVSCKIGNDIPIRIGGEIYYL
jgi:deoxycytidylate deaminase